MTNMRRVLGLRGRLGAAFMLVAAVTLAVATAAVLTPLEHRLRDQDIRALHDTALASRESFADLDASEIRAHDPSLVRLVRGLAHRADAQIAVVDARGRPLAGTDLEGGQQYPVGPRALAAGHVIEGFIGSGDDRQAQVAMPVKAAGHRFAVVLDNSLRRVTGTVAVVRRALINAALISLLAALLLGTLLATRLVRRLRALRDTAIRVAELGPTVEVHADNVRDEVGDLTRSFAMMQEHLRAQEHARRTFVATASHELRTPLQSLLLMLDLLHDDLGHAPDLAQAREDVDAARSQAQQLSELSSELLDLSRLDAGVRLRDEPVELTGLCRSVLAEFERRAAEADVELKLVGMSPARVLADPGAVAQIVRLLVDNALRFSPRDGRIEVTAGGGAITIADEGQGVLPQERELIFERFRRGQSDGGGAGFGLGLAIGRELARRMGGDLRLDPKASGGCFTVTLPPAPPEIAPSREDAAASPAPAD